MTTLVATFPTVEGPTVEGRAVEAPPAPSLVELLLHDRLALDVELADAHHAARRLPGMIALSLAGYGAFGLAHGWAMLSVTPQTQADLLLTPAKVAVAYAGGFFGAKMVSLPSAYFYALLAGVRTHPLRLTAEAMRAQATQGVVMLGIVPVYFAGVMGLSLMGSTLAPILLGAGYILPLFAGLWGVGQLYGGLYRLVKAGRAPGAFRTPMPALLVLAWTALVGILAPLAIFRLMYTFFGG